MRKKASAHRPDSDNDDNDATHSIPGNMDNSTHTHSEKRDIPCLPEVKEFYVKIL